MTSETAKIDDSSPLQPGHTREALWQRRIRLERAFQRAREAGEGDLGDRLSRSRVPEWILRGVGLWNRGIRNALRPRLVERDLPVPALPDHLQGFRLLHVSDFHFNAQFPQFARIVRDLLSGVEADLCVFTGDYQFSHRGNYDRVLRDMAIVMKGISARHGVLGILGNHDLSVFVEPFRELGIDMLINENRRIRAANGGLWIAGVDDQHRYHCESLALATEGIPPNAFTILLAHSPELAMSAPGYGIRVYLCGHTHWGQVQLPGVGALTYNSRCASRFCEGSWQVNSMAGYTTAGIGTTDLPLRFNCPSEACVLTLVPA